MSYTPRSLLVQKLFAFAFGVPVVQTVADTKVAACSASLLEWVGRRHLERLVLDAEALRRGVQGHTGVVMMQKPYIILRIFKLYS